MAALQPAPFRDLVTRLYREPSAQGTLFELPRRRWRLPEADEPDLSVDFHGQRAGAPLGPAAGPHTQMAQNILLSYVAGGRILELKTVQVEDRLDIPRPCIDMTNVGYNVEWSQELSIEQSLRQYVGGAMLVEMFRQNFDLNGGRLEGLAGAVIYDVSVGYDLAGIQSDKVRRFLATMRNAHEVIEQLRMQIPREFSAARKHHYSSRISNSVTLSTFHGCPADEIEKICEHLIADHDFNVIVKMNPPMLGRARLEHVLHDELGYGDLRVNPRAFEEGLSLDEGVEMCRRLSGFAAARGRGFGCKFCNTLEVLNHRDVFGSENRLMYLSGQPLHVITMTLVDEFRRRVGPELPISFSAGIDRGNFPLAVACGFVPVTVSTDLLRPGGYGRMSWYLQALIGDMRACDAADIDEYVLRRFGQDPDVGASAELRNTAQVARMARKSPRYRAFKNRGVPRRIESHLTMFDCIGCDKCIPVCPNAANFLYSTPSVSFEYHDVIVLPDGSWRDGPARRFELKRELQIACFGDFCNDCGNCDTFCPEYGAPYLDKPVFHRTIESLVRDGRSVSADGKRRDGYVLREMPEGGWIRGRIADREYLLTFARASRQYHYHDGVVEAVLPEWGHMVVSLRVEKPLDGEHRLDMGVYHALRYLREGVLDPRRVNQINVQWMNCTSTASGAARQPSIAPEGR